MTIKFNHLVNHIIKQLTFFERIHTLPIKSMSVIILLFFIMLKRKINHVNNCLYRNNYSLGFI